MTFLKASQTATRSELAAWSTLSRNEIAPFLERFGVVPLRRKYPVARVYAGLLGLRPATEAEEKALGRGFVRLGEVADRIGVGAETLLADLRAGSRGFPPLYVFGARRHLFLRAQIEEMLASPRNVFPAFGPGPGHAVPEVCLPAALGIAHAQIESLLSDGTSLPAHILSQGVRRFIVADVVERLSETQSTAPVACDPRPDAPPAGPGGLLAQVVGAASAAADSGPECTRSAPSALRGGFSHGKSAEAKLSPI